MRHELDVVPVEAAQVREAIAEALATGIVLLEVREAAGHRMPAGVDIFAFGSSRWIIARCRKLFGILSMKSGRSGLAVERVRSR